MLLQTLLGKTLSFWKCTLSFLYLFFFWHNSTTFSLILLCTHCMLTFFFQSCHCCPSHVHDKWQAAVQPSLCCLVLLSGKFQSKSCVKHALQDVRRSNYYNEIFKKKVSWRPYEWAQKYLQVLAQNRRCIKESNCFVTWANIILWNVQISNPIFLKSLDKAASTCWLNLFHCLYILFYFIHLLWWFCFFVSEQCYLYKNEQGQNDIVTTLLPSSAAAGKYYEMFTRIILTFLVDRFYV